jgi:hypothetical protein
MVPHPRHPVVFDTAIFMVVPPRTSPVQFISSIAERREKD